jgi:hypothetical protein
LNADKGGIETGGARLRSRIIERPVHESSRLSQDQIYVNRPSVDRGAPRSDFDSTIETGEYADATGDNHETRIIEDVSLTKTVEERDAMLNETIRNTETDVEDLTDEERLRRSRFNKL